MFNKKSSSIGNIDKFFYPKSIAVIGASTDKDKIGGYIFSEIVKKSNIIEPIPINVKSNNVQGIRAYPNIKDVGRKVDLAIIAIPGAFVLDSVKECAKAGIKNIVIISAGFKETGEEGKKKEEELKEIIKSEGLSVIGPNCLGFLNPEIELNCSFAKDIPSFGGTALISQSGAVVDAIIDWSFKYNIGFSKVVSIGNMAGVNQLDMLKYLKEDKKTTSIVFYMETLENGKEFSKLLHEVSKVKPVIIIKPGTSDNAKKAIGSHTGSLAQDNILVETLIQENNGIIVKNLEELFNVMVALKGKPNKGNKLAIVTNAGGPGVISTDATSNTNFELYKFSDNQKETMRKVLPREASVNNPIDILGDGKSDRYLAIVNELVKVKDLDNILILLTPQIMTDSENIAKALCEISKKTDKNLFASFIGDKEIKRAQTFFNLHDFPNFGTPSEALNSMNYLYKYKSFDYSKRHRDVVIDDSKVKKVSKKIEGKKGILDYELTKEIMKVLGIDVVDKINLKSEDDIFHAKLDHKKKYVLKADGEGLVHKKELEAVVLNVNYHNFEDEASAMFTRIRKVSNNFTVTCEEMVSGTEAIVGLKHDSDLGNFIMFGAGGTYVSVFKDINFSTCPLDLKGAKELVQRSKVNTILKGFRGSNPVDYDSLYDVLMRISYLEDVFPQIKEVDLNPIICNENGIYLVDVKLLV